MKSTGIVRKVDELGRIVLPIELRRTLDIVEKDALEIYVLFHHPEEVSTVLYLLRRRKGYYSLQGQEYLPLLSAPTSKTVIPIPSSDTNKPPVNLDRRPLFIFSPLSSP